MNWLLRLLAIIGIEYESTPREEWERSRNPKRKENTMRPAADWHSTRNGADSKHT